MESNMTVYWLSFSTEVPPQHFSQDRVFQLARYSEFPKEARRRIRAVFSASGVERRNLHLPVENYQLSESSDEFHERYLSGVRALAPLAAEKALEKAGLRPEQIDFVIFASCTGYSCPGFSLELAHRLRIPSDRPTANLLGMGCSAWVPALARAWDFLVSHPGSRALVIAAEICSAAYWMDQDFETAVGNAIFADGAAAAVLSSQADPTAFAKLEGFKTLRDERFLGDMGFTQKAGRLRVRLDREIPEKVSPLVVQMIRSLEVNARDRVIFHPGGKRILGFLNKALGADWDIPIGWSREVLKSYGNMSSPTSVFVFEESLRSRTPHSGERGGWITMGPGLSVEGMRFSWL